MQGRERILTITGVAIAVAFATILVLDSGETPNGAPSPPAPSSNATSLSATEQGSVAVRQERPSESAPALTSTPSQLQARLGALDVQAQTSTPEPQPQTLQIQMPDGETGQVVNAVLNGAGEFPPDSTLRLLSANPMRDDRFQTEPVDPAWAPGMEAAIYSVVSAVTSNIMEITEVECRTTICRAIADHRYAVGDQDPEALRSATESAMRLFAESFRPLVASPNGRLNSISISGEWSESGQKTIFSLSGPPFRTPRPGQP
jgi:hypothetical protein